MFIGFSIKLIPISILKRHFSLLSHVAKHIFIVTLTFSVVIVQTSTSPWCVCVLVGQVRPTLYHSGAVAHQAPLSLEFSTPEYWSGLPFPSPEDLPDPVNKPGSPALQADSLPYEPLGNNGLHWNVKIKTVYMSVSQCSVIN